MYGLAAACSRWLGSAERVPRMRQPRARTFDFRTRATQVVGPEDHRHRLAPEDHTVESFEKWLDDMKFEAEDADEAAALHAEINALMGWPSPGVDPVVKAIETIEAVPLIPVEMPMPTRAQLEGQAAAERFVEWVRMCHPDVREIETGKHLGELYTAHCNAEELDEVTLPLLRQSLARIGIQRHRPTTGKKHANGVRYRPWVYKIEPMETVAHLPWPELQEHKSQRAAA